MKIAISLPDDLFNEVEKAVAVAGTSRSAFIASALEEKLRSLIDDEITLRINAAIASAGEDLDFVHETSTRALAGEAPE